MRLFQLNPGLKATLVPQISFSSAGVPYPSTPDLWQAGISAAAPQMSPLLLIPWSHSSFPRGPIRGDRSAAPPSDPSDPSLLPSFQPSASPAGTKPKPLIPGWLCRARPALGLESIRQDPAQRLGERLRAALILINISSCL